MSETKDIVERLRGHVTAVLDRFTDDASLQKQFYIANRNLKTEAADEITRLRSLLQEAVEALEKLFSDSDESDFQDDGFDNIHVGWRDYKNIRAIITKIKEQ